MVMAQQNYILVFLIDNPFEYKIRTSENKLGT